MTNPTHTTHSLLEPDVLGEPCLRCGAAAVRVIVYGPLDGEAAPIFECRECGFEWGEAIRDLLT